MPDTRNANAIARRHHGLVNFPRTSPSSAAPANINACAHAPCASMWMVEFVKNVITGNMRTPSVKAIPGQR